MAEYILSIIVVLITIILIPIALKSKNRKFSLCALIIPMLTNIALYFIYEQHPTYGYLAIVGFLSLFLIRKKKDDTETQPKQNTETQPKQNTEQS